MRSSAAMLWLLLAAAPLLAPIQILGCAPAEADRLRQRLTLELANAAATAIEVRCPDGAQGAVLRLAVQVGDDRMARRFPADTLAQPGGARVVAMAAADLLDDLRARPTTPDTPQPPAPRPSTSPPPTLPPAEPPHSTPLRLRLSPGVYARSRLDDLQPGVGVAAQVRRGPVLLEAAVAGFLPQTTDHALGRTEAIRLDGALAVGRRLDLGRLALDGLIGWRVGQARFSGTAARDGAERTVAGIYGGPFLASRVEAQWPVALAVDLGWSVWPVTGRVGDAIGEVEEGLWLALGLRFGIDL